MISDPLVVDPSNLFWNSLSALFVEYRHRYYYYYLPYLLSLVLHEIYTTYLRLLSAV